MPTHSLSSLFGAAAFFAFASVACGGSTSAPLSQATDDDAGTPAATDAAPPTPSVDGATLPTPTTIDAAPGKPQPDMRLDPIEVGRAWTYNVKVLGFYPSCENGVHTATALSTSQKAGKTAHTVQSLCKNAGTYDYSVDNDRVYFHYLGAWRLSTDEPVQAGHKWSDDFYDYVWQDAGKVTVAAGTFDDCWKAKRDAAYESSITFCRGVGPVIWHYEDGLGNGYEAVLVSKNF